MATTTREERTLLSHEEFSLVEPTHYPAIKALPAEELRALATRLRDHHNKARDLLRAGRRARAGKGEPRAAASALGTRLAQKKQAFAAALKRVNSRFDVITAEHRRAAHTSALRAALARKNAQRAAHPGAGATAGEGMRRKAGARPGWKVDPRRVGSIGQATRNAQARRDG